MKKILAIYIFASILFSGCITKNYYCSCKDGCKCDTQEITVKSNEPIVSPDRIDSIKQDDGAPHYPNITPWYHKDSTF